MHPDDVAQLRLVRQQLRELDNRIDDVLHGIDPLTSLGGIVEMLAATTSAARELWDAAQTPCPRCAGRGWYPEPLPDDEVVKTPCEGCFERVFPITTVEVCDAI